MKKPGVLARGITTILTLLGQAAAGLWMVFLFSLIFGSVDVKSLFGWLISIGLIGLGFWTGSFAVGWASLRWPLPVSPKQTGRRALGTAIGLSLPLLVLLIIGLSLKPGSDGYDYLLNPTLSVWQPILANLAWLFSVLGFHIPGWFSKKN